MCQGFVFVSSTLCALSCFVPQAGLTYTLPSFCPTHTHYHTSYGRGGTFSGGGAGAGDATSKGSGCNPVHVVAGFAKMILA